MVKTVAGDMVGIVSPFPPRNADSGQTISGEKLSEFIVTATRHYLVVAGIVTDVSALDPEETQQAAGTQMSQNAVASQNAVKHDGEHESDGCEGDGGDAAFLVEQTNFGKLGDQSPVVSGHLCDFEILKIIPGEEFVQVFPRSAGMVSYERIGYILAC